MIYGPYRLKTCQILFQHHNRLSGFSCIYCLVKHLNYNWRVSRKHANIALHLLHFNKRHNGIFNMVVFEKTKRSHQTWTYLSRRKENGSVS